MLEFRRKVPEGEKKVIYYNDFWSIAIEKDKVCYFVVPKYKNYEERASGVW